MSSPYTYPQYYYTTPYLSPYYHQPHISPFTKNATYDSAPSVGSGRIGADSAAPFAPPLPPRALEGMFLTVADFFVDEDGNDAAFVAFARSLASMSATISFDWGYSRDSKYSCP
ncbi:hypothetical protein NUW54_g11437 [Trametes sanguinea]|uniref:Uncharacterized protein n=1 Tax=Trametes sanguinea TaxID=158606 RepID=A0ACC1NES9_9APHY|nr:hypothetical protein NUW54_g11437 [Trametes sanguinea]